ncbi:MAG TPA: hypothetical protein VE485_17995, partial [Mycobacterium sp.]|nr:hypothetical protein [Mycobacterium sp.]
WATAFTSLAIDPGQDDDQAGAPDSRRFAARHLLRRTRSRRISSGREGDFTTATPRGAGQQHRIPTVDSNGREIRGRT